MTRHIRRWGGWCCAGALVFGCGGSTRSREIESLDQPTDAHSSGDQATSHAEIPAPTRPGPTVVGIGPLDISTALGVDAELQVLVSNLGSPVGTELLDKLSSVVTLRTWPELDLVPINDAAIEDVNADGDSFAHVYLSPTDTLSDRWYAVVVGQIPEGLVWSNDQENEVLNSGERANRFRPDSWPVVRSVQLANKDEGKQALYVDFSERVIGDAKLVKATFSDGSALPCERQPTGLIAEQTSSSETSIEQPIKDSEPFQEVLFVCTQVLVLERGLTVSIQTGLSSTSGVALSRGSEFKRTIVVADWVALPNGLLKFSPDEL